MPVSLPTMIKFGSTAYGFYKDAKSAFNTVRNTVTFGQKAVNFARRHTPHLPKGRTLAWA